MGTLALLSLIACREGVVALIDVDEITIGQLRARRARGERLPLVDVREEAEYRAGHLPGALHVPRASLPGYLADALAVRGAPWTFVTVCNHGVRSALAAAEARGQGWRPVLSLREGTQGWAERGLPLEESPSGVPLPPVPPRVPERWPRFEQIVATTAGLGVKPAYMLLCLGLLLVLRRARARDLVLIRRGLLIFLVGESFCAANFLSTGGSGVVLDLFHAAGMVGMGLYLPWGLFVLLDERVLRLRDASARCAVQRFCGRCVKKDDVSCAMQRIFLFGAATLLALALLPWTVPLAAKDHLAHILGTDVAFAFPLEMQLVELRLFPTLAAVLLLLSLWRLRRGFPGIERAQLPFFAAFGLLSFSLFRLVLLEATRRAPVWSDFWEELTELLTIAGVGLVLWLYRGPLGLRRGSQKSP